MNFWEMRQAIESSIPVWVVVLTFVLGAIGLFIIDYFRKIK